MSAVLETPVDFGSISADIIETSTGKKIKEASAVRWVWQCFKDIKLWDHLQPAVLNSLTLAPNPITILRRCQPYPLTNCEYEVPRHEAKRYGNFGEEIPENDLPGTYAGSDPKTGGASPHIIESKFAYSAAKELSEMYAKEYGLVVLEPLTGNEDSDIVQQIFEVIQPVTYRLATLDAELAKGKQRIEQSKLSPKLKVVAKDCLDLMKKGCAKAIATAREHHGTFARDIQQASAGKKGHRAFPSEYDEFIAGQLGVEVPQIVQTKQVSDRNEELLGKLAERELARGNENEALNRALAQLEETNKRLAVLESQRKTA